MVQLPVEVRHMVAGHLSRPLDLKKLCLTNKDWYDPAVKVLYNEMYLLIGGDKDRNLVYTFNPQNHALGHIRGLDIKVIEGAPTALVEMTMQLILEYLPENILKGFFWCNATAFSVDLIRKLYSKQSCVEDVQVVPTIGLAKPYDVEEIAPVYDRLVNNDRRLDLVIDSEASFQLSQYLLQMSSSVQTLRIVLQDEHQDYDFLGPGTHASPRDLPSILVRRLFSIRLRDQIAASVANLQRLELCFVDLVNATAEWNCLVGAHRLKALSLIKCGGTGAFFKKICSRSSVDVEELTLTDHGLKSDRLLEIIEASIVRCDKLKSLALSLMGTDRCIYVDDICQVGSNLELLSVHIFGSDDDSNTEWCWDDEEFAAIIDACPKLKQLSCAFPGVDLLDDPSPSWVTRARCLLEESSISTLQISPWPKVSEVKRMSPTRYRDLLRDFASNMLSGEFSKEKYDFTPSVQLIAFGCGLQGRYDNHDGVSVFAMATAELKGSFNGAVQIARPISCIDRRYDFPGSYILEYETPEWSKRPANVREESDELDEIDETDE